MPVVLEKRFRGFGHAGLALRGGIVSVAMQYGNGALQITGAIILARLLTPEDFGDGLKSALLCELAFAVASRTDWHGYRAKQSGAVVYFALERTELTKPGLAAYLGRCSEDAERPPIASFPE